MAVATALEAWREVLPEEAGTVATPQMWPITEGRTTPSIDALMRIAEVFKVSADHLLFDDVPRRPLHAAEDVLGDRLAVIADCRPTTSPLNVVDRLVAKSRLRAMASELG